MPLQHCRHASLENKLAATMHVLCISVHKNNSCVTSFYTHLYKTRGIKVVRNSFFSLSSAKKWNLPCSMQEIDMYMNTFALVWKFFNGRLEMINWSPDQHLKILYLYHANAYKYNICTVSMFLNIILSTAPIHNTWNLLSSALPVHVQYNSTWGTNACKVHLRFPAAPITNNAKLGFCLWWWNLLLCG